MTRKIPGTVVNPVKFPERYLTPRTVTLDAATAPHRAVGEMRACDELPGDTNLRSSEYLDNLIGQYHRGVKSQISPMLVSKRFKTAVISIAMIELLRRIRKEQFVLDRLYLWAQRAPTVWDAVLATP